MINQIRLNTRSIETGEAVALQPQQRSMAKHGTGGAMLGATWFGAAFPLVIGAFTSAAGAGDLMVYAASGALFGAISGGAIGAVIGGGGR